MLSFFGTECPGESGPIPRRAFRRAWEWDLTSRATLYRRNDSVGLFFSPVAIKLLQIIRTKTSFHQFCIRFIRIYRLLWSSARVCNELLTNHRRDIKTQGECRWTRQGWIYPMFDVIRHIFIIPLQNQRNSKGENNLPLHNGDKILALDMSSDILYTRHALYNSFPKHDITARYKIPLCW